MINNKITELRKKLKITEKELAEKVGMSLTGFRQAMAKDDFKVSTLTILAKILKAPVSYFFDETGRNVVSDNKVIYANTNGDNNNINLQLHDCVHKVRLLEVENEGLKNEIKSKDKIIKLLETKK